MKEVSRANLNDGTSFIAYVVYQFFGYSVFLL